MNINDINRNSIFVCVPRTCQKFHDDIISYIRSLLPKKFIIVTPWDADISFDRKVEDHEYQAFINDNDIKEDEIQNPEITRAFAKISRNRENAWRHLNCLRGKGMFRGVIISTDEPSMISGEFGIWAQEMHIAFEPFIFVVSLCKNFDPSKYPRLKDDVVSYLPWGLRCDWDTETKERFDNFLKLRT